MHENEARNCNIVEHMRPDDLDFYGKYVVKNVDFGGKLIQFIFTLEI